MLARDFAGKRLGVNTEAPTSDPSHRFDQAPDPAPWITEEYLEKQHHNHEQTDSQFLQLHGCVWAERSNSWLPAGSWDKLPTLTVRRWRARSRARFRWLRGSRLHRF